MSTVIAPPQETVVLNTENPWPGLVSFSEANEAFFFGREQEIAYVSAPQAFLRDRVAAT